MTNRLAILGYPDLADLLMAEEVVDEVVGVPPGTRVNVAIAMAINDVDAPVSQNLIMVIVDDETSDLRKLPGRLAKKSLRTLVVTHEPEAFEPNEMVHVVSMPCTVNDVLEGLSNLPDAPFVLPLDDPNGSAVIAHDDEAEEADPLAEVMAQTEGIVQQVPGQERPSWAGGEPEPPPQPVQPEPSPQPQPESQGSVPTWASDGASAAPTFDETAEDWASVVEDVVPEDEGMSGAAPTFDPTHEPEPSPPPAQPQQPVQQPAPDAGVPDWAQQQPAPEPSPPPVQPQQPVQQDGWPQQPQQQPAPAQPQPDWTQQATPVDDGPSWAEEDDDPLGIIEDQDDFFNQQLQPHPAARQQPVSVGHERRAPTGANRAMVVVFGSYKGGSGKTTCSIVSAAALAEALPEKRVLLVDGNVAQGSVATIMRMRNEAQSILDAAVPPFDKEKLVRCITTVPDTNLDVLPAPPVASQRREVKRAVTPELYVKAVNALRSDYDFIVVDSPVAQVHGEPMVSEFALKVADRLIVVVSPNTETIENNLEWLQVITDTVMSGGANFSKDKVGVINNQARDGVDWDEPDVAQMFHAWAFFGSVPESDDLQKAANNARLHLSDDEARQAILACLFAVTGEPALNVSARRKAKARKAAGKKSRPWSRILSGN